MDACDRGRGNELAMVCLESVFDVVNRASANGCCGVCAMW